MTPDAPNNSADEATRLLNAASAGDPQASDQLLPIVYDELRRLAHAQMAKEPSGRTLQPTALVHEAYMRLIGGTLGRDVKWDGRWHFFGAAALAMRRILVERARARNRLKRGGGAARMPLTEVATFDDDANAGIDLCALDDALKRFEAAEPRRAQVVSLRYFAGLTIPQTAAALGVSESTVKSDWNYSRAWLHRALEEAGAAPESTDIDGHGAGTGAAT